MRIRDFPRKIVVGVSDLLCMKNRSLTPWVPSIYVPQLSPNSLEKCRRISFIFYLALLFLSMGKITDYGKKFMDEYFDFSNVPLLFCFVKNNEVMSFIF